MEQRKEINVALENINAKERPDKHDQLIGKRKELDAAMAEIRQAFAAMRERNQERGRERDRPRERERDRDPQRENPKLQHAENQLEHMLKAHGHLREAGMTEIAQMVGERAEKLQRVLRQSGQRRRESGREEVREERRTDQPRRERTDVDEAFRKKIGGAIQELSAAIRSLRNDMEKLKKERR